MIANARIEEKPYPSYKRSGVSWTGDVPEHWEIRRLGDSAERCINGTWGEEPDGVNDLACIRVADFDRKQWKVGLEKLTMRAVTPQERPRRLLKPGDLLLEKSGGGDNQLVGVVVLYDHDFNAVTSNFVGKLEVRDGYHPKYLTYLHATLYALEINKRSIKQTTGIQNIDAYAYLSESVAYPPFEEQAAIARYLDDADQRIRAYVSIKERLIALLEEERQAVIHQAVTRGLDPNVRLKPSGAEWLGDVPEHWEVRRIKSLSVVKRGASPRPIDDQRYFDETGEFAWVRISDVTASNRYLEKTTQRLSKLGQDLSVELQPGSLFLSIAGSVGKPIITKIKCCIHDGFVYFPKFSGDVEFLYRILSTEGPFARLGKFGTQLNLNTDTVGDIYIGWPPTKEQQVITHFVDAASAKLDAAVDRARRQIDLMEEYRTRSIADVVTGKIDVRRI